MLGGSSETIVVVTSVFLGISFTTVCLRCYVRLRIVRAFGWDDKIMVAAMIFNIAFALCGIIGAGIYGIGQEFSFFVPNRLDDFRSAMLCWWLGQIFYIVTGMLAKISIAVTLLRVTIVRAHALILYGIIGCAIFIAALLFFFLVFACHPVNYFWDRLRMTGSCLPTDVLIDVGYTYSVVTALLDFAIGLLPVFIIWRLQMTKLSKIGLSCILGIGCIASAAVIVRIPFLHDYKNSNFLYSTVEISIWSNVEAGLGITAGSLTTLRPLARVLFGEGTSGEWQSRSIALSGVANLYLPSSSEPPCQQVRNGSHRNPWATDSEVGDPDDVQGYGSAPTMTMMTDRSRAALMPEKPRSSSSSSTSEERLAPPRPPPAAVLKKDRSVSVHVSDRGE